MATLMELPWSSFLGHIRHGSKNVKSTWRHLEWVEVWDEVAVEEGEVGVTTEVAVEATEIKNMMRVVEGGVEDIAGAVVDPEVVAQRRG